MAFVLLCLAYFTPCDPSWLTRAVAWVRTYLFPRLNSMSVHLAETRSVIYIRVVIPYSPPSLLSIHILFLLLGARLLDDKNEDVSG